MDIFSHGLWANLAFRAGKQTKKLALWGGFFGVVPDLFSFGLDFLFSWTRLGELLGIPLISGSWKLGTVIIPDYIFALYNIFHSLIVFLVVFFIIWFLRRRIFFWPLAGWGLHILMDIPTHSAQFFPTPFLWPISDYTVNGISWGIPTFLLTNWVILISIYIWLVFFKDRRRSKVN